MYLKNDHNSHSAHPHNLLVQSGVSLADKTWFGTGGLAQFYCQPTNASEFVAALDFARNNECPIFVLGKGANILVSDFGFSGLVIHPALNHLSVTIADDRALVTAGAGVSIEDLINYCLDHQVLGLEEFSGIPGSVGGSVYINLHYFQFLLAQFLAHAQVIEHATGIISSVDPSWFNFGYNQSRLHEKTHSLAEATFALRTGTDLEIAYARGRQTEIIRHRVARYPSRNTCGSFFRNFKESEVTIESNGKKMIYVAYYLDKIGVKGQLAVGDAIVSYQHANMLVNRGKATSTDIVNLARAMQELVYDQFGIIPQPECQLVGFSSYPLLV